MDPRGIMNSQFGDFSYANCVLQSLSCLDYLKEVINNKEIILKLQQSEYSLTNNVFNLIFILNKIHNKEASSDPIINSFIDKYNKYKSMVKSKNILNKDPFHFLYFLLQFLHLEINRPENPNYDMQYFFSQESKYQNNDTLLQQLFIDFYFKTQNSIISDYFFFIEKYTFSCPLCGTYYKYSLKNIFRINIDKAREKRDLEYPNKKGLNLNINDILNYYFSTFQSKCKNCNNRVEEDIKILINTKEFILYLDRKNHYNNFNGDIDFSANLDLKDYIIKKTNDRETKYLLKACICFNGNKYLSYCKINYTNNKNNEVLYRFIDNQVKKL